MSNSETESLTDLNALPLRRAAEEYTKRGITITPLQPCSKRAYKDGWNQPGYSCSKDHWNFFPADNIGMILEPSGICVLDIDNKAEFITAAESIKPYLPHITEEPFWKSSTAGIHSGKPNRGKLLFKKPDRLNLTYHKLLWNTPGGGKHTVFELRTGYLQDVLPPSIHPDTKKPYQWIGSSIEAMPADLIALWVNWNDFEKTMKKADRFYVEEPPERTRGRPRTTIPKGKDYIGEWNSCHDVREYLEKYGYVRKGNRYLSPDSTSGTPGVVLSDDGKTFYAFNESDYFADGRRHNAFDLLLHFEYNGSMKEAVAAVRDDLGITRIKDTDLLETARRLLGDD